MFLSLTLLVGLGKFESFQSLHHSGHLLQLPYASQYESQTEHILKEDETGSARMWRNKESMVDGEFFKMKRD